MDHVWALNASSTPPTLPGSLEIGYPTDTGGVGTTPGAWWYYMITEELRNTITVAGLTPTAGVVTQLSAAIVAIAQSAVGVANRLPARVVDTVGVTMSGLQTVDSVSLANGDRVLSNVGTSVTNGIWIVNSAGAWTRSADYANGATILEGAMYEVSEGSVNNLTVWALHSVAGENVTVGTTACQYINITSTVTASINAVNNALTASLAAFETFVANTYAPINNPVITGLLTAPTVLASGVPATAIGQYNAVGGSGTAWFNTMLRNDGTNVGLYQSAVQASELLANTAVKNAYQPFSWNLTTGVVTIDGTGLGTVFGGLITAPRGLISAAGGGILTVNSTDSTNIKFRWQDVGVTTGYMGAATASSFYVINAANTLYTLSVDQSGNGTFNANVTAYSDERKKTNWRGVGNDFIKNLATLKSGIYDRNDIDLTQAGVGAQSLQKFFPEVVLADEEGTLSVAYGNAALVACVELAKEIIYLRKRVATLETLL